jgi:hypothetical protein
MAWERYVLSDHVHQASGMVAEQLGCTIGEALTRMRVEADARGQSLEQIALDVLDRILRFHDGAATDVATDVVERQVSVARWAAALWTTPAPPEPPSPDDVRPEPEPEPD